MFPRRTDEMILWFPPVKSSCGRAAEDTTVAREYLSLAGEFPVAVVFVGQTATRECSTTLPLRRRAATGANIWPVVDGVPFCMARPWPAWKLNSFLRSPSLSLAESVLS